MIENHIKESDVPGKRVLIVAPFFEAGVDYQELQMARVLHAQGYQVTVVTTNRAYLDKRSRVADFDYPFKVIRLEKLLRIRDTFYPVLRSSSGIKQMKPDLSFLIHPGHGLGYFLLTQIDHESRIVSFFGDLRNEDKLGGAKGFKGNPIIQKVIKDRWYKKVIARSSLVVATTNETVGIISTVAGNQLEDKLLMTGLGYDSASYYYDTSLRKSARQELHIPEDSIVFLTLTRIIEGKPIQKWVDSVLTGLQDNPNAVYIVAGFMASDFSRNAKAEIASRTDPSRVRLLDFTDTRFNNALYNCADFSIWFAPTISIQQSMGTGLPAIMPNERTLDHLVRPGLNGFYYESFADLSAKLRGLNKWPVDRVSILKNNQRFSYSSILEQIISFAGD
jgi:hypothetical protein